MQQGRGRARFCVNSCSVWVGDPLVRVSLPEAVWLLLCENGLVGEEEPVLTAMLWPSDRLLVTATVEEACEGETESCSPCLCIY